MSYPISKYIKLYKMKILENSKKTFNMIVIIKCYFYRFT